jgi:hypothetical protein
MSHEVSVLPKMREWVDAAWPHGNGWMPFEPMGSPAHPSIHSWRIRRPCSWQMPMHIFA